MTFACARALRVCAMLALPVSAFAQTAKTPTIFSPSTQVGTVNLRAAVVLADYEVKPLPLLRVVAQRTDRADSAVAETDLDGRVAMTLRVGTYTVRAKTAQPVGGRQYAWAVRVVVRSQRTEGLELTNSNASMADSVATVVAVAPTPPPEAPVTKPTSAAASRPASPVVEKPLPSPKPATQKPTEPVGATNKVVAAAEPPKSTAPQASPFAAPPPSPSPMTHVEPKPHSRTNTSGVFLGLSFDASSISSDDLTSSRESGPGVAGQLGWGVTKNFALILDASAARISSLDGDFDLAHVDVGGRWHFVNRSAFVPFVEVGYAGRAARKQDTILSDGVGNTYTGEMMIMGGGVSAGGGFEYFAMPSLALGGSFKWTSGQFTQVKFDNVTVDGLKLDATSARFNMGFTWYPMGRGR